MFPTGLGSGFNDSFRMLTVTFVLGFFMATPGLTKEIMIDLATAQRDPIIEICSPPPSSIDTVVATSDGILIDQQTDLANHPTGVAGFKMLLSSSGDFKAKLDFTILLLDSPSEGWGQGLVFALCFNDQPQTQIKLNQVVMQGQANRSTMLEIAKRHQPSKFQMFEDFSNDGSMIFERKGVTATMSIRDSKGERVLTTIECPKDELRGIEVWSTRQTSGNSRAKILLKKLLISADAHNVYKNTLVSYWSAKNMFIVLNLLLIFVLGVFWVRRSKRS
jgi:hypothetical protein